MAVELPARRSRLPPGGRVDFEAVVRESGNDVPMGVEDLLLGCLAVCHEGVDAIGTDRIGLTQRSRQATRDGEEPMGGGIGQVRV